MLHKLLPVIGLRPRLGASCARTAPCPRRRTPRPRARRRGSRAPA